MNRHKPYARISHIADIVEFFGNAVEIAYSVAVCIVIRTDENLIIIIVIVVYYVFLQKIIIRSSAGGKCKSRRAGGCGAERHRGKFHKFVFHNLPLYRSAGHALNVVLLQPEEQSGYRNRYQYRSRAETREILRRDFLVEHCFKSDCNVVIVLIAERH